jgi:hypothetical protein
VAEPFQVKGRKGDIDTFLGVENDAVLKGVGDVEYLKC